MNRNFDSHCFDPRCDESAKHLSLTMMVSLNSELPLQLYYQLLVNWAAYMEQFIFV